MKTNARAAHLNLSKEEKSYLKEDLKKRDAAYDEKVKMLRTETRDKHYHSDLDSGVVVHQTRESVEYAVALLKTGDKVSMKRAKDIIKTVLPMQEKNPAYEFCGIWPYYPEDPLRGRKAPVDYNWADFIAVPLIDVMLNHSDYMGKKLTKEIKEALVLAAKSIVKRDVQPDYTNIFIMGTYVCYVAGDICNQPELTDYAKKRLATFYNYTIENKGFTEYNSPTYTIVAMDELLRLENYVTNPTDKEIVDNLYTMCWEVIARHYHEPSGQWCGPNLRSYSSITTPQIYRLLYNASDGKINLPTDFPRIPNVIMPHKIPVELIPEFTEQNLPDLVVDTFTVATNDSSKDIIGKLYKSPAFALASVNQGYMWNQTRPLIAHWGTPNTVSYLQVRFLHDMYDFSAINIFSVQDTNSVLSIFNISNNGGDRHPSIDKIQNQSFKANDLRLRIELGGNLASTSFTTDESDKNIVKFISRGVQGKFQIPYAKFGDKSGYWVFGNDGKIMWADYILYSGEDKIFNLNNLKEVVLGLYLTIGSSQNDLPCNNVKVSKENDFLELVCENLGLRIKALSKPVEESNARYNFESEYVSTFNNKEILAN